MTDWITAISTAILTLATISLACSAKKALDSWKNELVSKKLYELNHKSSSLIKKIEEKLNECNNPQISDEYLEENEIWGHFFRDIKEELNELLENLSSVKQDTKYIEYFKQIADLYSQKASDEEFYNPYNPETDENEEDHYINDFWSQYSCNIYDDNLKYVEFNKNIKEAKKYYKDKITKFYTKYDE